jgi:hypothetical protein
LPVDGIESTDEVEEDDDTDDACEADEVVSFEEDIPGETIKLLLLLVFPVLELLRSGL